MAEAWSRARSAGRWRWRAPSQTNRPCARGFARACASCLRCGSWRSDPERRAGLCQRGRRRRPRCDEEAGGRNRLLGASVLLSSLKSCHKEFKRRDAEYAEKKEEKVLINEESSHAAIACCRRGRSQRAFAGGK